MSRFVYKAVPVLGWAPAQKDINLILPTSSSCHG